MPKTYSWVQINWSHELFATNFNTIPKPFLFTLCPLSLQMLCCSSFVLVCLLKFILRYPCWFIFLYKQEEWQLFLPDFLWPTLLPLLVHRLFSLALYLLQEAAYWSLSISLLFLFTFWLQSSPSKQPTGCVLFVFSFHLMYYNSSALEWDYIFHG